MSQPERQPSGFEILAWYRGRRAAALTTKTVRGFGVPLVPDALRQRLVTFAPFPDAVACDGRTVALLPCDGCGELVVLDPLRNDFTRETLCAFCVTQAVARSLRSVDLPNEVMADAGLDRLRERASPDRLRELRRTDPEQVRVEALRLAVLAGWCDAPAS
jgi:hypothetical protein